MTVDPGSHALASISLTHVYFNPADKISYVFAYITLAPIAIMVFYASVIVSRREIAGILMLAGQFLNEALNYVLKERLQQDRPHIHLGDGYGMPSSHSQFIWYFAVYGSLYMYNFIHVDHAIWKILLSTGMLSLAILVSTSRIYLGYHTLEQVIIGSLVGAAFGVAWYTAVKLLHRFGTIDFILDLGISKFLYLRDMSLVDNVAKWEHERWTQLRTEKLLNKQK